MTTFRTIFTLAAASLLIAHPTEPKVLVVRNTGTPVLRAWIAAAASSLEPIWTKAKPRGWPVMRSEMMATSLT